MLLGLSELAIASGDAGQAVVLGHRASGIFRDMGALLDEARAHDLLSTAHAALGDVNAAQVAATEAAALTRKMASDPPASRSGPVA